MKPDTNLYAHQRQAVKFILSRGGVGALFMDCGTGKCLTALSIFSELKAQMPDLRMVVVCPLSLIESAWMLDIQRFTEWTYFNAHDKKLNNKVNTDIVLINYESMIRNKELAYHIKNNLLVIDESSRCKNNRSITTKKLLQYAGLPRYKVIMSGTPAPNGPVEYWGQLTFLDENALHKSFYGFRNTYFHLARGGEVMQGRFMSRQQAREIFSHGWEYAISQENLARLMAKINPYVFRAKKEECLDLPDQVDEVRLVELSTEQHKHYLELKRHLITELAGQFVTAQVALAKIMKLREVTSGFLMLNEKPLAIANPVKIKELSALLEELGNQPVIIWGNFVWEIEAIQKLLGEKAVSVYGKTDDKHTALEEFKAGKYQYLVANMNSISHGVTLVNCSTQVFFSLSYSWEQWIQCKNRIHRIGAVHKCTYIHILAKDTIDEQIYKVLQDKGNMENITLGMVKK